MGSQALETKSVPASSADRRAPGALCEFVKRIGCLVSWVDCPQNAKLYSWAHPEYKESAEVFEAAEDCAEHFMRHLTGKLAYKLDLVAVPRDGLRDVRLALVSAKPIIPGGRLVDEAAQLVQGWLS